MIPHIFPQSLGISTNFCHRHWAWPQQLLKIFAQRSATVSAAPLHKRLGTCRTIRIVAQRNTKVGIIMGWWRWEYTKTRLIYVQIYVSTYMYTQQATRFIHRKWTVGQHQRERQRTRWRVCDCGACNGAKSSESSLHKPFPSHGWELNSVEISTPTQNMFACVELVWYLLKTTKKMTLLHDADWFTPPLHETFVIGSQLYSHQTFLSLGNGSKLCASKNHQKSMKTDTEKC
jgi:hypothetical protein